MTVLVYILISTFIVSLGGLASAFMFVMDQKKLVGYLMPLVSLSAGALIGSAFLHLLPDSFESLSYTKLYGNALLAFVTFFLIEKVLLWRHCHQVGECTIHTFGYMSLIGDSIHNFIDGLIIAVTFATDIKLGLITTFAISLHEIPQEIADFGVLLHSGYSKKKALIANFSVALVSILGGFVGYAMSTYSPAFVSNLLPFAAGGFIYVAASDLMPEIRREQDLKKSLVSFAMFLVGILIMVVTK